MPDGDDAASSMLAYLVAGAIFVTALGAMILVARGPLPGDRGGQGEASQFVDSSTLRDVLVRTPGSGWSGGGPYGWDPGAANRVGLQELGEDHVEPLKVRNLQLAARLANPTDGAANYEEVREELGLADAGLGFHVRTRPVLPRYEAVAAGAGLPFSVAFYPDLGAAAGEKALLDDLLAAPSTAAGVAWLADPLNLVCSPGVPDSNVPDILVIGSGANHALLAPVTAQVAAWVSCGGTLVILGSDSAATSPWLDGLLATAADASSGGLGSPDPQHPLLFAPDRLTPQQWVPSGTLPSLALAGHAFTAIVEDDSGPVLAASDAGAFGSGQILLARLAPTDQPDLEGGRLLHNLLVRADQPLFLDYGGVPPVGDAGRPAVAATTVEDLVLGQASLGFQVPVQVQVRVFPAA